MSKRFILFGFSILLTLFLDIAFGDVRIPVFTVILCGIVVVYEIVRPFIYTTR